MKTYQEFQLMLNKSKSRNVDKSMYKINIRECFMESRVSNYFLKKEIEQNYKNNFNKLIN